MSTKFFTLITDVPHNFSLIVNNFSGSAVGNKSFSLITNNYKYFNLIADGVAIYIGWLINILISSVKSQTSMTTLMKLALSTLIDPILISNSESGTKLIQRFYIKLRHGTFEILETMQMGVLFEANIIFGTIKSKTYISLFEYFTMTNVKISSIQSTSSPEYYRYYMLSYYDNWLLSLMDGYYLAALSRSIASDSSNAGAAMGVLGLTYSDALIPTPISGCAMGVLGLTYAG